MPPGMIRERTNVRQILGCMHQDGLPKRAIRTARRLLLVKCDVPKTRADRAWCRNWTAHERNKVVKEFGPFLPCPVLLLARRLPTVKRMRRYRIGARGVQILHANAVCLHRPSIVKNRM